MMIRGQFCYLCYLLVTKSRSKNLYKTISYSKGNKVAKVTTKKYDLPICKVQVRLCEFWENVYISCYRVTLLPFRDISSKIDIIKRSLGNTKVAKVTKLYNLGLDFGHIRRILYPPGCGPGPEFG